jgi:RNA polymerase sigma factor (sigma-70 family)
MWMQEWDDIALLREYVDRNSEEAFATLVTRHVNKVYSVALRHTRNSHQAEEITQAVFIILAKKSRHLGRGVVLSGWLYQTARLAAVTFIRSEIRRTRREEEAQMQTLSNETEPDVWMRIAPLLDTAMAGLNEKDRHAVVLRFFDGRSLREVGAALGGSEDAAKMRVNRAVEKLRQFFTKRGVVIPAAVLTTAIAANSVQAAPAALAHTATAVAFTQGATASGSTMALIKGTLKIMAWTKAKTAIVVGAASILAAGTTTTLVAQHHQPGYSAGNNAVVPYKTMDDVCQIAESADRTKLQARVLVSSKNTAVHPADISLTIQSTAKGPIPVPIGTNGQVLNFPHEKELRRENPPVIANQPKGTLNLVLMFGLDMPEGLTYSCRRVGEGIAEANRLIKAQAGMLSLFAPKMRGVVFIFPKSRAGKAKVEIAPASGKREYTADANGRIKLKIEKALLAEDLEIRLSEKPQQIVPDIE